MKTKRPLAPDFINQLDANLLANKPATWSARTHLVVYYSLLVILVVAVLSFFGTTDIRADTEVPTWSALISLLCVIGFIFWIIYLLRFNVFKRFGIQKRGDGIKAFALYFAATGFIVFTPFVPAIVETVLANQKYTSDELVKDVNDINTKICQLEYDIIRKTWRSDTIKLSPEPKLQIDDVATNNAEIAVEDVVEEIAEEAYPAADNRRFFRILDSAGFYNEITNADSLIKISDSVYKVFTCPDYVFVSSSFETDEHSKLNELDRIDLYKSVIKDHKPVNKNNVTRELHLLLSKYYPGYSEGGSDYYKRLTEKERRQLGYFERIQQKYQLSATDESLRNITQKKYRWEGRQLEELIRVWYYCTLVLALIVFIFRHTTVKTFFLSLLTGVLLFILCMIILVLLRADAIAYQLTALLFILLFGVIGLTAAKNVIRNVITGISLNLFTASVVFIPLLLVGIYYTYLHSRYDSIISNDRILYDKLFGNEYIHILIAEIAGSLILFLLIEPVIKKTYRKWFAQPEQ